MYAPRFKRLILELDTGEAVEINGAYIREVTVNSEFQNSRFDVQSHDRVTIIFDVFGNQVWTDKTAPKPVKSFEVGAQKQLPFAPKQLPFKPKLLPDHKK